MEREHKTTVFLFGLIILMFLLGETVSHGFASPEHIRSIMRTASFLGIVSIGQTLAVLTAGIDLSSGPLITLGNVFVCMFINGVNLNTLWALPVIIFLGVLFGAVNGVGVTYFKISPLVMTLAIGSLVTGMTLIFSQGAPTGLASPLLRFLAIGNVSFGLPVIVMIWMFLSGLCILFLDYTTFGRRIYYTGANERAAFLSGTHVHVVKITVYAISGACSALSGALMAGYTQTAFLGIGNEYTMWSITAVVIGGTSLTGGKGSYIGSIAGSIILILLESLLTVMNIPEAGRTISNGIIILVMISIYFRQHQQNT
ncbi:ABC transporter [candidate division KSB3 bacterium]|uniref:ABC transporter n=1 Tax=candidate division KSB3 bacterium TaxID=2044937 RepID=A0A2G6E6W3_9BACT|nr:MAG: ABC transporter [candidate division KSB3 bacterium]PIE30210.1 MAG: ABC transporter [candidate division KSB3 bacterium]